MRVFIEMVLTPLEWQALLLSLKISSVAVAVSLPLGIALAWLLARRDFAGKSLLDGLIHLPLVLPPVVIGYMLLVVMGRRGPVGSWLFDTFWPYFFVQLERGCVGVCGGGFSAARQGDSSLY